MDTFGTPSPAASAPNKDTLHRRGLWTSRRWGLHHLDSTTGLRMKYAARIEFKATNNIAKYEGLILGLNKAKALRAKTLLAKIDSQVIARQVKKEYMARELGLVKYLAIVSAPEQMFQGFTMKYIPIAENAEADELVKAASNNLPIPNGAFYQVLQAPAT